MRRERRGGDGGGRRAREGERYKTMTIRERGRASLLLCGCGDDSNMGIIREEVQ